MTQARPLPASFWDDFRHGGIVVQGVRLHYVEGGKGEPILLIPGWPQSWYAWRHVMPLLVAAGRRVIAVDPRGFGDSDKPRAGYDLATVAADFHALVEQLGLRGDAGLDVAGHDIGTWIGYAYAADWPADIRRLALFDAALPGVTPLPPPGIPPDAANVKTWHFGFNRLPDLPEILIAGREREFLSWMFHNKSARPWTIGPADLDEYVRIFSAPGAARAGFEYYRAVFSPEGQAQSRARTTTKLSMPVFALGSEIGVGEMLIDTMRIVASDVRGGVAAGCGHYILEECPETVAAQLIAFFGAP